MINPATINPLALPCVALAERAKLPNVPCIYFAIDVQDSVQYIGKSVNPKQRWRNHNQLSNLCPDTRIAWLEVSELAFLSEIERALIFWFSPPLNIVLPKPLEKKGIRVTFSREYPNIGDRIRTAREASDKPLTRLASDAEISVAHWNRIENERVDNLPIETLRKIEESLGIDLGVKLE